MAKKEDFKTGKAAPLDRDLEMPDFDFDSTPAKDDRKPIKKVMDGAYAGAKATLGSTDFIRGAIKKALPEGYGKAADFVGSAASEARGLYNNAASAIKPGLGDLTAATSRMLPDGPSKYKDILGKVNSWTSSGGSKSNNSAAQRDDGIQLELARIMGETAAATKEGTDQGIANTRMQEGLAQLRHKDNFAMLAGINNGVTRLTQYNDRITNAYQRKSLELQMRQHFTLIETLEESKRQGAQVKTALDAIAKNTGLPEFVKLETSERFKEQMRNKFFDNISQGLFSGKSGLMGKVAGKLNSAAMNTLSGFSSAMSSAAMGLDVAKTMKDMGDMDPSTGGAYGTAGDIVGVAGVNAAGDWLGKKARARLSKTKTVGGAGNKLSGLVDSYPELLNDFRKTDTSQMGGVRGSVVDFLKMLVPDLEPERGLEKDTIGGLTKPGVFTRQTNKSINEVIPGYLARIFRELKIMRTGDESTALTLYDFNKNSFADSKSVAASAMGLLVDKDKAEATKKHTNAFLDYIETEGGKLSPEARDALGKTLIEKNLGSKVSSADKFAQTSTYNNTPAEAFSAEIAAVMKKHLKLGPDGKAALDPDIQKRQNLTMGSYRQLGSRMTDSRGEIQNMMNLGMYDFLRESGLVDDDMKNVNLEKLTDMHLNGYKTPGSTGGKGGSVRTPFAPVGTGPQSQQQMPEPGGQRELDLSSINKSIADNSAKADVQGSNTILERIEQLMANNVSIAALAASETSRVANAVSPDSKVKGDLTVKELLKNTAVGSYKAFKGAVGLGSKLGKSVFSAAGTAAGAARSILGFTAPIAAKGALGLARFGFGSLKGGLRRPDIWMPGESTPRITSAKIDAGVYFDEATSKVIKTLKDISGTVVDKDGNVIITADELKKAVTKQGMIRQINSDVGDAFNLFGKIVGTTARGVTGIIPPALKFGFETATKVLNILTSAKDGPHDVYVPEPGSKPRLVLQATIMRKGGVYMDENSGGVVRKLSDITGAVTNKDGEVLLTEEEFKAGIVSKYGKRIRIAGRVDGAIGLIKNIARRGGETMADAIHIGKKIGGAGLRIAGNTVKGAIRGLTGGRIFGKQFVNDGKPGTADNAQIGLLMEIRDLLNNRLPEAKRRKGSWQDMATGTKKTTEEAKPGEKKAPGKGILQTGKDALEKGKDLWDMGKSALSLLGIGGGAATLAGGAAAATTGTTVAAGGAAAAAGGGGLLAMMGAAGTAIAGGVATIMGSPVILGALAVAALAGAGYMGYKYLTKNSASKLEWLRLAQYGLSANEKDKVSKIFELEDYLKEFVSFGPTGARLMSKGFKASKAFEIFGIAPTKTADLNAWTGWFDKRFKPVFLTHVTALKAAAPNSKGLDAINSLKKEDKLKYLKSVQYAEGPYNVSLSPFPDVPKLTAGSAEVATAYDDAMKELSGGGDDKGKQSTGLIGTAAAATVATTGKDGVAKADELNKQNAQNNSSSFLDKAMSAAATSFMMATPIGMALSFFTSPGALVKAITGDVKALQAARYRTYGLKSMDGEKVNALYSLEQLIAKNITFEGSGRAAWKGSASDLVRKVGKEFGISNNDDVGSNTWVAWFTKRFLPVFLSYMEMLKQYTGKTDLVTAEMGLKPADSLALANRIIATPDVWGITVSPWAGYELATDVKDTNPNIAALRATAKSATLGEVIAPDANKSASTGMLGEATSFAKKSVESVKGFFGFGAKPDIPDAEADDLDAKSPGGGGSSTLQGAGKVNLAGGVRSDGRGASQYLKLASGVTLNGLNPAMHKNLMGMIEEYGNKTGKATTINSGFRSRADQEAAYKKDPSKAAKPGTSLHEFGLAVDINSATLNEMDKLGLMRKYGFTRPVANEPWHTEPIGIQFDLSGAKSNPNSVAELIENSIGKGGGGLGTVSGISGHGRDAKLSRDIYGQRVSPMADAPNAIPPTSGPIPTDSTGNIQTGSPAIAATKTSADPGQADSPKSAGNGSSPMRGAPNATTTTSSRGGPMMGGGSTPNDAPGVGGSKDQLPDPKGGSPWQSMKDIIMNAAKMTGVSPSIMAGVAAIESGFQSAAKAGSSTATGLFQFVKSTWDSMVAKYGKKYGITADTSATDPKANALMGGEYLKENMAALAGVKKNPNATDAYIAHFLGASGAKKFFGANPNAIGAQVLPDAAKSNPDIFYTSGGKPKTISEIYNSLQSKMDSKFKAFGIDLPNPVTGLDAASGGKTETASGYAGTVDATRADSSGMQKTSFTPPASPQSPSVPKPPVATTTAPSGRSPVASDPSTGFSSFYTGDAPTERAPLPQNTKADTMNAIGGMGKTLETSLAVQQQQLETLIAIKTILEKNAGATSSQPTQPAATTAAGNASPTPPKAASSLPISLARTRQSA